ncbi:hypothetical protein SAMN02745181_0357 [Rubritalea squalenifaciens DSM 18772]|uniref:Polyketide cyclase / dehydrase and lipid transport n=1 Tax=Rubritalea squalenifaciens DSM 18772 TaxID=1123071 RepID=A0A1M6C0K2_9BACT|nr:hypothetical protein [Rubritalea squalenifaciens]SHI54555.1 hypothetical protein SAMN02745181_0357 [Rubritalea squalenifaciens DSM 18772]
MRKPIIISTLAALILAASGITLWNASQPVFQASNTNSFSLEHDGLAETYRELGGFTVSKWSYRQWFEKHDLFTMQGCVAADQAGTKVVIGGSVVGLDISSSDSTGSSTVISRSSAGVISEDGKSVTPKIEIKIEYDLQHGTATLLNTGQQHPLTSDKVYTVYLDKDFQISQFVMLDPGSPPEGIHPKLIEAFLSLEATKKELMEIDPS